MVLVSRNLQFRLTSFLRTLRATDVVTSMAMPIIRHDRYTTHNLFLFNAVPSSDPLS
jgi:hypothetical protein